MCVFDILLYLQQQVNATLASGTSKTAEFSHEDIYKQKENNNLLFQAHWIGPCGLRLYRSRQNKDFPTNLHQ